MKLTIYVPTFDRLPELRNILDRLHPQVVDGVELFVSDNHGNAEQMVSEYPNAQYIKRWQNIGCDGNCLSGLLAGTGEYVWVVGDDDSPYPFAVEHILEKLDGVDRIILSSSAAGETPVDFDGTMLELWAILYDMSFIVASTLCSMNVWRRKKMDLFEGMKHLDSRNVLAWAGLPCWTVKVCRIPSMRVGRDNPVGFDGFVPTMNAYTDALADRLGVPPIPFEEFNNWNYTNVVIR
jgi:glycosyltransferase involved in cell wall biosynthesis